MVENICVNAPGPALLGGSAGGSAAGEEDAEGVAVPGVLPASSPLNMRVNSPGPCGADAAGIADAGAAAAVGALHTGSDAALGLDELKIRVDSPEPCDTGAAGALGDGADGAGFSFRALNICVKLPGWPAACAGAVACPAAGPDTSLPSLSGSPAADADGIFSIEIGLKTLASSSEGRETGAPPAASGVRSACSIRVKSPCAAAADGAGEGIDGADGAGACAPAITSADGVENNPEAGGAEAAAGGALTGGTGAAAAGVSAGFWFSA